MPVNVTLFIGCWKTFTVIWAACRATVEQLLVSFCTSIISLSVKRKMTCAEMFVVRRRPPVLLPWASLKLILREPLKVANAALTNKSKPHVTAHETMRLGQCAQTYAYYTQTHMHTIHKHTSILYTNKHEFQDMQQISWHNWAQCTVTFSAPHYKRGVYYAFYYTWHI